MINGVYGLLAVASMLVYFLKLNWPWKAVITLFLIGVIHLAYRKMNLLWFENNGWLLIFTLANLLWVYVTVVWLDRWYKSIRPYGYRLEGADTD